MCFSHETYSTLHWLSSLRMSGLRVLGDLLTCSSLSLCWLGMAPPGSAQGTVCVLGHRYWQGQEHSWLCTWLWLLLLFWKDFSEAVSSNFLLNPTGQKCLSCLTGTWNKEREMLFFSCKKTRDALVKKWRIECATSKFLHNRLSKKQLICMVGEGWERRLMARNCHEFERNCQED